jgi:hypothetical protein
VVLRVEVPVNQVIEALLRAEWLTEAQALDRAQVERAVSEVIAEWSQEWLGGE